MASGDSKTSTTRSDLQYRFLIRPGDGFTRRLQRYAAANKTMDKDNSVRLPLLVEGPYTSGNLSPESSGCKSILVMAGGSGISVAISMIHRALATTKSRVTDVRLSWAVKRRATMESVANEELRAFLSDPRFSMEWYVAASCTSSTTPNHSPNTSDSFSWAHALQISNKFQISSFITDPSYQAGTSEIEPEGAVVTSTARPNIPQIIETAIASTSDKLAIVVCGPQSMTVDARSVVSNMMRGGNPDVKLFVENFGW